KRFKAPYASGRYKHDIPAQLRFNPLKKLKHLIIDAFVKIDHTSHFIILKTLPGNAQAVGALIDQLDWEEIMGSICGDDTCLIICRSEEKTAEIKERLLNML